MHRQNVAGSPVTGWEMVVVATGLNSPGQICGVVGGKLYYVSDTNTAIKVVSLASLPGTPATAVSGLTTTLACSFDVGGSGDLIFADGGDVFVVPAASLAGTLPVAKSSLTAVRNAGTTAGAPNSGATVISSVVGTTGECRPAQLGCRSGLLC